MKKITKLSIATMMIALIALTLTFAPSKYAHACDFNCICDEEIDGGDNDETVAPCALWFYENQFTSMLKRKCFGLGPTTFECEYTTRVVEPGTPIWRCKV